MEMKESEQNESDYEVYRGLTARQIEISFMLEQRARIAISREDVKSILEGYLTAYIPVTNDLIRRNAAMVRAGGWVTEMPWLEEIAARGEPEPFRRLCIEHGLIEEALRVLGANLSSDDLWKMIRVRLRARTRDERNYKVLRLAYLRLKDWEGLRDLLNDAIKYADAFYAQRFAKDLKTELSLANRRKIAEATLKRGDLSGVTEEEKLFTGHGMSVYRKRLFQEYLKKGYLTFWQLQEVAAVLSLKVPIAYLELRFRRLTNNWQERMAVAEELAKRSFVWRRRQPKILAETRDLALRDGNVRAAEEYGQRCGKPLTIEELKALIQSARMSEKDEARVLLAERIFEHLHDPPTIAAAAG